MYASMHRCTSGLSGSGSRVFSHVCLYGGCAVGVAHQDVLDLTAVDRVEAIRKTFDLGAHLRDLRVSVFVGAQRFRRRHVRHRHRMFEPRLVLLPRRRHAEDRAAVLNRRDAARREAACRRGCGRPGRGSARSSRRAAENTRGSNAVAVRSSIVRFAARDRLREHLAAEDVLRFGGVAAAIEIFLDALDVEQIEDVAQDRIHGRSALSVRTKPRLYDPRADSNHRRDSR